MSAEKVEISFNNINEDCLRMIIFDYLELSDQIALSLTCSRLRNFIFYIWERTFVCADLKKIHLKKEYSRYFVHAISNFCEEMMLGWYELTKYECDIRASNFPQLKYVHADLADDPENTGQDDMVFLITVLFPNLKKLRLRGRILGNYIYRLKDLKELRLDLLPGKRICYSHVARFLKMLPLEKLTYNSDNKDCTALREVSKCKTLKELSTNCHISQFDHAVHSSIQKVRKITFTERLFGSFHVDSPLEQFTPYYGDNIKCLVFVCFTKIQDMEVYSGIHNMRALRRIVLSEMQFLNSDQLMHIILQAPLILENFYYLKSSWNDDVEDKLVKLVQRCNYLKLLDVSDTAAGVGFLHRMLNQIDFKQHEEKMLLRCHNTKLNQASLELVNLPKNLDITFEKQTLSLPTYGSFQIEFL